MDSMNKAANPDRHFSREVLEFSEVIALLRHFLSGPISEPHLNSVRPRTEVEEIRRALGRVAEAREFLRGGSRPALGSLKDPRPLLEKLRIEGVVLEPDEILGLLDVARAACDLRSMFAQTPLIRLHDLAGSLSDFRELVADLDGKILPDGSLDSSASPGLGRVRRALEGLRRDLQSKLEKLLRRLGQEQVLQDELVTLRNGRFVIPVRVEEKRRVPGVVHGMSSSGATVYVEPLETVPLNNKLVELQDREFAEIRRVLGEFSQKLRVRCPDLGAASEILSEIDLAFAKAEFARKYDCCIPEFVIGAGPGRCLVLKDVRHPLLEKALESQYRRPVPLTIELGESKTMMLISGPNAGGKTVALKTIGVSVLMAQAGLPVAAGRAQLSLFGRVLADIGDQQSIQANLSTFSAHIANIQAMVEVADRGDLVLLDEVGASTEPNEGAALAIAILEHFHKLGVLTFATTHHPRLKAYAAETREALNAAMEFDEATLQPTYKLLVGLPGKSSALDIAARLGLDPFIVAEARGLLNPADSEMASLIEKLHEQKAEIERQLASLEQQRSELEARRTALIQEFERERRTKLRELDARLEETLRQLEKKVESFLAELRSQEGAASRAARRTLAMKRAAREEWNAQVLEAIGAPTTNEEVVAGASPAVGDRVRVASLSTPGTVIALQGDEFLDVEVGRLRMRVRKEEVAVLASSKSPPPGARRVIARSADMSVATSEEINVIGATAEEARERVDKFLDQAYVAGRFRLRIVHGHGKGILRKALHEMLASHPHVEKFYSAPPQEGGTGATIVELKL